MGFQNEKDPTSDHRTADVSAGRTPLRRPATVPDNEVRFVRRRRARPWKLRQMTRAGDARRPPAGNTCRRARKSTHASPTNTHRAGRRRGVILLIVLAMLTLFAIAGLTFVLYAERHLRVGPLQPRRRVLEQRRPRHGPQRRLRVVPRAVHLRDHQRLSNGDQVSLRGHSLADTMYGSYDALNNVPIGRTLERHRPAARHASRAGRQRAGRILTWLTTCTSSPTISFTTRALRQSHRVRCSPLPPPTLTPAAERPVHLSRCE